MRFVTRAEWIDFVRHVAEHCYGHWIDEATAADLLRLAYPGQLVHIGINDQPVLGREYPPGVTMRAMVYNLRRCYTAAGDVRKDEQHQL